MPWGLLASTNISAFDISVNMLFVEIPDAVPRASEKLTPPIKSEPTQLGVVAAMREGLNERRIR
jgi:hypothetical protein